MHAGPQHAHHLAAARGTWQSVRRSRVTCCTLYTVSPASPAVVFRYTCRTCHGTTCHITQHVSEATCPHLDPAPEQVVPRPGPRVHRLRLRARARHPLQERGVAGAEVPLQEKVSAACCVLVLQKVPSEGT